MKKYDKYIKYWQRRIEQSEKEDKTALVEAKNWAEKCALFLGKKYSVKRVYLFGSLVDGSFKQGSDIDLAVEGLKPKDYFKALVELFRISNGFKIDLIPLENSPYKTEVIATGKLLYG